MTVNAGQLASAGSLRLEATGYTHDNPEVLIAFYTKTFVYLVLILFVYNLLL